MLNNILKPILLLLVMSPSAYAFVGAIHLFEKGDKLALVIGDRHIAVGSLPDRLHSKNSEDFQVLTPFISELVRNKVEVDWVLESSKSKVIKKLSDADSLLSAMAWYFLQVERQHPRSGTRGIHSDYRRFDVAQLILRLHHNAFAPLVIECFGLLKKLDLWTPEELEWFSTKHNILAADLVPIVNRYFAHNEEVAAFLRDKLNELLLKVEHEQQEWLGEKLKFRHLNTLLTDLETELEGDGMAPAKRDIAACQSELNAYLQEMHADMEMPLTRAISANVKKTRTLDPLNFGLTKLSDCAVYTVADVGFFLDFMKSQDAGHFSVLFAGRGHATAVSNYLKELGYTPVFEEGKMIAVKGHVMSIQANGEDDVVETSDLERRLSETLKRVLPRTSTEEL